MENEGGIREEQGWMKRKNKEENGFSVSPSRADVEGENISFSCVLIWTVACDQELLDCACKCARLPEAPFRQPVTDLRLTE